MEKGFIYVDTTVNTISLNNAFYGKFNCESYFDMIEISRKCHTQKTPKNPKIVIVLVKNEGKCTFRKDAEYQVIKNLKGKKKERKQQSIRRTEKDRRTDGRTKRGVLIAPTDGMAVTLIQCSNYSCS